MDLYKSTNRFIKNYNFLKDKLKRQPTIEELSDFDHLHYNGISTVEKAISKTNINAKSIVLDIGSGIGGPARYIASKTKAKIYAVEIQSELNNIGLALTNDYKLKKYIKHLKADILEYDFSEKYFDNIVSWLALYHIPERPKLLKKLYSLLKKDGYFYTEDFYLNSSIKEKDKKILTKDSKGNAQSYEKKITLDLRIFDEEKNFTRTFTSKLNYKDKTNKFQLKQYENEIQKQLLNDIIKDILIFLTEIE